MKNELNDKERARLLDNITDRLVVIGGEYDQPFHENTPEMTYNAKIMQITNNLTTIADSMDESYEQQQGISELAKYLRNLGDQNNAQIENTMKNTVNDENHYDSDSFEGTAV